MPYNPVFLSYVVITPDAATLYIDPEKVKGAAGMSLVLKRRAGGVCCAPRWPRDKGGWPVPAACNVGQALTVASVGGSRCQVAYVRSRCSEMGRRQGASASRP